MKKKMFYIIIFASALALVAFQSATAEESAELKKAQETSFEGTWDLVSRTVKRGDQVLQNMVKDEDNFGMKMIHDGYWMFTGQETKWMFTGQETNDNQTSGYYGYSAYSFEDNILTEYSIYRSDPMMFIKSFSWKMTLEGDKLMLIGGWPPSFGPPEGLPKDQQLEVTETYIRKTTSDSLREISSIIRLMRPK